jgi:hypothetical protein
MGVEGIAKKEGHPLWRPRSFANLLCRSHLSSTMLTAITYFAFALTVLFPLYFVYHAWTGRFRTVTTWGLHVFNGLSFLILVLVIGRGDMAGGTLRYGLYAACALALLGSWVRVSNQPVLPDGRIRLSWGAVGDTVAILALLGWGLVGYWPDRPAVDLTFPLRGEDYHVVHGGGTYPVNYHGLFASSQRYALDVAQLNDWGFRAAGLYPDRLRAYEVYGATVYSPLTGTVVDTTDHLPDLTPGRRQAEQPAGNHVWLRRDSLYVVLAHLKEGSVRVTPGEQVRAGHPIAAVGNTGNTSEPHLHLHAVTVTDRSAPNPDSLLGMGTPVPLKFDGRFLTRNDQFTQIRLPEPGAAEHAALSPVPGE